MAELLLELYSEEIPPQLQIEARYQIKQFVENSLKANNIKYKELSVFSSPTRLTLLVKDIVPFGAPLSLIKLVKLQLFQGLHRFL